MCEHTKTNKYTHKKNKHSLIVPLRDSFVLCGHSIHNDSGVYSALFQLPTFKIYFPEVKISIEVTQTRLRRVQRSIQYGFCKDTRISALCPMGINSPR